MNLPVIIASSVSAEPGSSIFADLPPWIEAGLVGLFIGGYIGLWFAMLYRHRAQHAFRHVQRQLVTNALRSVRPDLKVFPITTAGTEEKSESLQEHVDALSAALGSEATAEWSKELQRQQSRLVRLHRALE